MEGLYLAESIMEVYWSIELLTGAVTVHRGEMDVITLTYIRHTVLLHFDS